MDELIKEYEKILDDIYDHRTRGDYTWYGLLAEFANKAKPILTRDCY